MLASDVPVSLLAALKVLVAVSAAPPGLLHHLSFPVGVVPLGRPVHGAHWLNHFLFAFANVNAGMGFFFPMP